ncbi:MAG: hypothetical protein NTU73_09965 [Ignavibacteriae bacterium]|nr:hypothetical protein [Ignavibacteriota bacterium]
MDNIEIMTKSLNRRITTYWWNFGSKKKDFEGTYKEWFKKHKISIRETEKTINFTGSYGSMQFKVKMTKDYEYSFNQIIKMCLTFLGDKALLRDGFNREYKINWG